MTTLFDPNDDKQRLYEKFLEYYGEFHDRKRKDLVSKNVVIPSNVYEALYPQSRKDLLSKNVPVHTDILSDTEQLRREALSRIVPNISDVMSATESYRREQLSKNGVSSVDLVKATEPSRRNQLSRNVPADEIDHEANTEAQRRSQLSRNVSGGEVAHERETEAQRRDQLSRNVPADEIDHEANTEAQRRSQLSRNVPADEVDHEANTEAQRRSQLSRNVQSITDVNEIAERSRLDQLSRNVPTGEVDHESNTEAQRRSQLSRNVSGGEVAHERETEAQRRDQLSRNVPADEVDHERDTEAQRRDQLSRNVPADEIDHEANTEAQRRSQLSRNVPADEVDHEANTEAQRRDQLSRNVSGGEVDHEKETESQRNFQLSRNVPTGEVDHEANTEAQRNFQLSRNVPTTSDVETVAEPLRLEQLKNNIPFITNLEESSKPIRESNLSRITRAITDIDSESQAYRIENLSRTIPTITDIDSDNAEYRTSNLERTVPSFSDLESDSVPFRTNVLGNNVPSNSDILTDSQGYWQDNMSNNVPSNSDLETDSLPYLLANLSNNVPSNSDLLIDSIPYLNNNLSNNVPSNSDLLTDSLIYWQFNMSNNVPSNSDLLTDSQGYWQDNMSNNVPSTSDLLTDSQGFLNSNLANNVPSSSDIATDSTVFRDENLSSNVPGIFKGAIEDSEPYRREQLARNEQFSLFGVNITGFGTQAFLGVSRNFTLGLAVRELLIARNKYNRRRLYNVTMDGKIEESDYVSFYGTTTKQEIVDQASRNGTDSIAFLNHSDSQKQPTDVAGIFKQGIDGTPEELMGKTVAGNPLDDLSDPFAVGEFKAGPQKKGIKEIVNRIGSSRNNDLSINYQYGSRTFIVGINGENKRERRQRYSVTNPYAAGSAGYLPFYITNYAVPDGQIKTMYLPPYIQSYQENNSANWNQIEFLGRPEPLYTYNNAIRGGSISFYVLTDFAQEVELGTDFSSPNLDPLKYNFDFNFTGRDIRGLGEEPTDDLSSFRSDQIELLIFKREELRKQIREESEAHDPVIRNLESNGEGFFVQTPSGGTLFIDFDNSGVDPGVRPAIEAQQRIDVMQQEVDELSRLIEQKEGELQKIRFAESNDLGGNVYNNITQPTPLHRDTDISSIRDIEERLDDMKQGLQFQPAYFSGDKIDFKRRMAFLIRTTRPRANDSDTGFSFTKPPVCHLRLGDWLHHDVIINDVNYDFSDTVWCLEAGQVQPMWAQVTMAFKIIGPYNDSGVPLTASDEGGYYGPRTKFGGFETPTP